MGSSHDKASKAVSRRNLLRAAGLSAGAAAVGAAAGQAVAAPPAAEAEARPSGYQETGHVKAYYQSLLRS